MADFTEITFTKQHSPYNAGDAASFEHHVADALIKAGVAIAVKTADVPEVRVKVRRPRLDNIVEK